MPAGERTVRETSSRIRCASVAEPIPAHVRACDAQLHAILERVAFSRFLNPMNGPEAYRMFLDGGPTRFEYLPFPEPDELLAELERALPEGDHPAAELVRRSVDSVIVLVLALRDRTAEAFDRLNVSSDWYPTPAELDLTFPDTRTYEREIYLVGAKELEHTLRAALDQRGLTEWSIELDRIMTARVLVDSAKRLLRLHPDANFHVRDLRRLVVHEIDVHVLRGENGSRQALRCFETGLPGSLLTEEGLAIVAEEVAGVSTPGVLSRQVEVLRAVDHARRAGIEEVYRALSERVGPATAWGIVMRIKRGLADPNEPGVYAKDTVYLRGRIRLRAWLEAGGSIGDLYVGKVSMDDPIAEWREQGWVSERPVPALWDALSRPGSIDSSPGTPP
jgi:hypothetical protein